MATISLKIAGTSYTLQQASIRSLVHTVTAGQPASLAGEIYTTAIPTTALAYGDLIELWVNSVRRFAGWLGPVTTGFGAQGSYVRIEARDILGRLRNTPLARRIVDQVLSPASTGADHYLYTLSATTTTEFTLFGGGLVEDEDYEGYYRWAYGSSSAAQLSSICAYAGTVYSPGLSVGTLAGLSAKNQAEPVTNLYCLSGLQRCTKYRPDAVMWVDASGTTPTLHCITRDNCTAVTIDLAARDRIRDFQICAREDLRLLYLRWRLDYTVKQQSGDGVITTPSEAVYTYGDVSAPADRRSELKLNVGTYSAYSDLGTPWDEFPSSAAADYWAATSALHYQGSGTLYPPATVDLYTYGLGQVHDFTGGATELATCHALVRAASYDHVAGTVALEYGPPDTLSPQDVVSGSASGALSLSPTPPAPVDPADPENPDDGDLPAQVTGELYNLFSVISSTGTVQTIEGTAEIKGWEINPGFTAATPPDKYLSATASGSVSGTGTGGCGWSNTMSWSGTSTVNPATGAITAGQTRVSSSEGTSSHERLSTSESGSLGYARWGMCNTSATTRSVKLTPYYGCSGVFCGCDTSFNTGGCGWFYGSGEIVETLGNKDSDAAALARLGDTWGTPTELSLRTFWEQRTTGFSFSVRRCRLHDWSWTCSIYGLPVRVSIPLYKYAIGGTKPATPTATQPFVLDLVQFGETTTSPQGLQLTEYFGKATLPDWEIPIEQGYVIEAGTPTITLL